MQDGGVIFFDLTQLVLRVVDPTPDGIGRVELAYARHLLAHYPRKVRFLLALPQLVQVIPTSVAARYIKAIEAVWQKEDDVSDRLVEEIDAFLNADKRLLSHFDGPSGSRPSRRSQRFSMIADLVMSSALQFLRPRNLGRYSRS